MPPSMVPRYFSMFLTIPGTSSGVVVAEPPAVFSDFTFITPLNAAFSLFYDVGVMLDDTPEPNAAFYIPKVTNKTNTGFQVVFCTVTAGGGVGTTPDFSGFVGNVSCHVFGTM